MHPDAPLRRITTWLAIFGYTLVASGLPLPLGVVAPAASESAAAKRVAGKDRSRPFPCMDKPCGCDTAERCFTSCCCHSPAETLLWAKAHDVEPAVLLALERRVAREPRSVVNVANMAQKPSCCSRPATCTTPATQPQPSCCATASATAEASPAEAAMGSDSPSPAATSCATAGIPDERKPATDEEPEHQPRSRTVTLRAMLACGGIVAEWFVAGAALPPQRIEVPLEMTVVDVCASGDESGECLRASPAAPPPRAA